MAGRPIGGNGDLDGLLRTGPGRRAAGPARGGSATVTVAAGCRGRPPGTSAGTGTPKRRQIPPAVLVPKVAPPSASDRCGPIARHQRYGPLSSTAVTLSRSVRSRHGPYRIIRSRSVTATQAVAGRTPSSASIGRNAGSKRNGNRATTPVIARRAGRWVATPGRPAAGGRAARAGGGRRAGAGPGRSWRGRTRSAPADTPGSARRRRTPSALPHRRPAPPGPADGGRRSTPPGPTGCLPAWPTRTSGGHAGWVELVGRAPALRRPPRGGARGPPVPATAGTPRGARAATGRAPRRCRPTVCAHTRGRPDRAGTARSSARYARRHRGCTRPVPPGTSRRCRR